MELVYHIKLGYCIMYTHVTAKGSRLKFYVKNNKLEVYQQVKRALDNIKRRS